MFIKDIRMNKIINFIKTADYFRINVIAIVALYSFVDSVNGLKYLGVLVTMYTYLGLIKLYNYIKTMQEELAQLKTQVNNLQQDESSE